METIRSHWRDSAGWKAAGLPLTTTSDEACKLYDAAITQYVGWYDDPALGGLSATVSKIRQADPDFVMGQVLETGLTLIGTGESVSTSEVLRKDVARLAAIAKEGCPSRRERLHVDAVLAWSRGRMSRAAALWEDI
ncbi:conserved hypothetical protein, partial [Ixodes scapularis]